jgi:hypothetical protein
MTDDNQEAMDQEDLEFLRELCEIPDKITIPPDFHSRVMQTIYQREAILPESEEQSSREQLLRFPAKKTALPKARKWFEWRKMTRYAPAAVIVLVVTGVLYFLHEANQNSFREMEKRIATIAEQLRALESENQERYEEFMTKLEDIRNELSQSQVPRVEGEKVGAAFSGEQKTPDNIIDSVARLLAIGAQLWLSPQMGVTGAILNQDTQQQKRAPSTPDAPPNTQQHLDNPNACSWGSQADGTCVK